MHPYNTRNSPTKNARTPIDKSRQAKGQESKAARQRMMDNRRLKSIEQEQQRLENEKLTLSKRLAPVAALPLDHDAGEGNTLPAHAMEDAVELDQGERLSWGRMNADC